MDINLLVLNVGNTRLAVGVFKAGTLEHTIRLPIDNRTDWQGKLADAWSRFEGSDASVVAASVNPPANEIVEHAVAQATNQNIVWVGRDLDLPISVQTTEPAQTGVDRVLNVAAAYEQMQKACVVVDAGTAITVDLCDDGGNFLGGAIAAGAKMQLAGLHARTAKLPAVDLVVPDGLIGKSTTAAIQLGVYAGIRGMVKELVEGYATELGTWPDLIATGGDAELLFTGWELVHAVAPDLTLYGIALAYSNHHINHGT